MVFGFSKINIPILPQEDLQDQTKLKTLLDTLFEEVKTLCRESLNWPVIHEKEGVTTRRKIKTRHESHAYIQRYSKHTTVSYDQLRDMLYIDHSLNEPDYVHSLTESTLLRTLGQEAGIFSLHFNTPPLSSNREFIEMVATKEEDRFFMVVSQPVTLEDAPKKGYVRGAYQAWELVSERRDQQGNTYVAWICIQRSAAGGLVPNFLSDHFAGKDFHKDVLSLIKRLETAHR